MDWIIHAVKQSEDNTLHFDYLTDFHTHGLEKHGLKNLCMFFDYGDNGVTNANLINTIAELMIDGDDFPLNVIHCLDDAEGNTVYKFVLNEFNWHGEDNLKIIVLDESGRIPEVNPCISDDATEEEFDNIEKLMRYKYQIMAPEILVSLFGE